MGGAAGTRLLSGRHVHGTKRGQLPGRCGPSGAGLFITASMDRTVGRILDSIFSLQGTAPKVRCFCQVLQSWEDGRCHTFQGK